MPTEEAHALSYASGNWLLRVIRVQNIEFEVKGIEEEGRFAEMEIRAILDRLRTWARATSSRDRSRGWRQGSSIRSSARTSTPRPGDRVKDSKGRFATRTSATSPSPGKPRSFTAKNSPTDQRAREGPWTIMWPWRTYGPSARASWSAKRDNRLTPGITGFSLPVFFSRYYDLNHCRIIRRIAKLDADWRTFRAPFRGRLRQQTGLEA